MKSKPQVPANLAGLPAISLPVAKAVVPRGGTDVIVPVGMQLMAKRFDEETLLYAAQGLEVAMPFHTPERVFDLSGRRPALLSSENSRR